MKFTQKLMVATLLFSMSVAAYAQKASIVSTTATDRWVEKKSIALKSLNADKKADIEIYADSPLQEIEGFGGTFNEHGWDVLQVLPKDEQEKIIADLFGEDGINFSFARTPIGSSDYALSYYSLCDVKEDFEMRDFNIDRDRYILIPYIKSALAVNPDLKIWGSPWTPPAWMKVNEHYTLQGGDIAGRTGGNRMESRKNIMGNATAFNMQVGYLKAYALYFSRYVQEYAKEGVDIFAIMPQNEIAWSPNWPCCTWRAEDFAIFIGTYLSPRFKEDNLDTEIWLGTINFNNPDYIRTFLKNKDAAEAITGVGFQWTGVQSLPYISKEYPTYKYMQTENICGEGENDWTAFERSWDAVCTYFNNQTSSYMYWNMILDETGKSAWGWPQNSMIIINRESKEVRYTDEFYLMKHLSHFMTPNTKLLKTNVENDCLAFDLGNGKILIHVVNKEENPKSVTLSIKGKSLTVDMDAKSINTLML